MVYFDLHVALRLTVFVVLQLQTYHMKCLSIKWDIIYHPCCTEHMAHQKRSFIVRDFVL